MLHTLGDHAKHFGIIPNTAPLNSSTFRGTREQRTARMNDLLSYVLLTQRSQFLHKIDTLEEMVMSIRKDFCEVAFDLGSGASAEPSADWRALDNAHFDLNTCLRDAIASNAPQVPKALTESEAIRLAQAGNAAAFEFLYALHSRRVYALCLRMVSNPSDAEDLMQEAFLQLFRKIATFRGESAFSTWLHRMTVNVVLMRLRKKALPVASLEETTEPDEDNGGPRADSVAAGSRPSAQL